MSRIVHAKSSAELGIQTSLPYMDCKRHASDLHSGSSRRLRPMEGVLSMWISGTPLACTACIN
jgi:hypothetical protein